MTTANRLVEVLSRRRDVLRTLLDAPMERHVLVDHVDDSKSTVYKGVSQLEELGLVEATAEGLAPTLLGRVALVRYDELARTVDLADLLAGLPREAVDPSALVGAEAVAPDSTAVDRHLARVGAMLRDAETVRGVSPAISSEHVALFHERVVEGGLEGEFVLAGDVVAHLRAEHPDVVEAVRAADGVTLYRTRQAPPFTLLVAASPDGTEVGIEVGDDGLATGIVVNDTAASVDWAERTYERHRRAAERVTA